MSSKPVGIAMKKRTSKPKKGLETTPETISALNSKPRFMTVKQLQRSKIPVVETIIDGHSLYLRPPSIKMTERIHESTSNLEGAQIVAEYLGRNLFNDELAIHPVGSIDEFKEGFSPVELIDLFQRLNEGLVVKKKVN